MKIVQHKTSNHVLGDPPNWDHKELPCSALPVRVDDVCLTSHWKPSESEIEQLKNGGFIALSIFGRVHPVVSIFVED